MKRIEFLRGAASAVGLVLVGCAQQPQPTAAPPEPSATAAAQPTAAAPSPTVAPTNTPAPTIAPTAIPTSTPAPTVAPTAATPTPSATRTVKAIAGGSVAFALTGKLNSPRWQHTATLIANGKVLVVGGLEHVGGSVSSSAEIYDPATGKWTVTGNTGGARYGHTATLLKDGRVLVAGGGGGGGSDTSAELYDPATGKWAATGDLANARSRHTATLLGDGKVLVAGGGGPYMGSGPQTWSSAELYDPATGTWSPTGKLAQSRANHCATLLSSGKVLVAGGEVLQAMKASLHDPAAGRWTVAGDVSNAGAHYMATLLTKGPELAANGEALELQGSPIQASAELYDPATGTWAAAGSMNAARSWFSMTLLADGRVLMAGGSDDGRALSSAEVYDPTAGKWTAAGSLKMKLQYHTATLLGNGSVLVAGGYPDPRPRDPETEASSSVELFDPTTGAWTEIGSLKIGRGFHTATLLNNGKMLVAGGSLGKIKDDDDRSAAAELGTYVPAS